MGRPKKLEGVRKRGSSYQKSFTYKGKQRFVTFKDPDDMEEAVRKKKLEIDRESYCANASLTVKQWFDEWINRRLKVGAISGNTYYIYSQCFKRNINPRIGSVKITKLERRQIMKMQEEVAETVSIYSANQSLATLHTILKGAVMAEIIERNPADNIPKLKDTCHVDAGETIHRDLDAARGHDITGAELEKEAKIFFSHCENCYYKNALLFMYRSGVRAGECLALEWRDIRWPDAKGQGGKIHINRTITVDKDGKWIVGDRPKTKASNRSIDIDKDILEILEEQKALYLGTHAGKVLDLSILESSDFVFPNTRGGFSNVGVLDLSIRRVLERCEKAGEPIPHFSSHAFRHTIGSLLARKKVPINTAMDILGHSSAKMLYDVYAHSDEKDRADAMKQIQAAQHEEAQIIAFPQKEMVGS